MTPEPNPATAAAEELQPCPFGCGELSTPYLREFDTGLAIYCGVCGARGPIVPPLTTSGKVNKPAAVALWNTRPHFAAQAAECELCGRGIEKPHVICGDCQSEYSTPPASLPAQAAEIERLKAEHEVMADRLIELEEIAYDDSGKLYWRSCGDRLFDPTGESP